MSLKGSSKHPKAKLELAKKSYMEYDSLNVMSQKSGIPKSSLQHHVKKWKAEREMQRAELFAAMSATKKVHFTNMTQATITIMEKALTNLATRKEAPTMQEATKAAEIMSTLDRITRLDDGTATDIISNNEAPLTVEVIKEKIALDPFSNEAKEIEYREEKEND